MTYTLKLNLGDTQETLQVDYKLLQEYSAVGYLLYKGYWYKQVSKNWDFENIDLENPTPNFIINLVCTEEKDESN